MAPRLLTKEPRIVMQFATASQSGVGKSPGGIPTSTQVPRLRVMPTPYSNAGRADEDTRRASAGGLDHCGHRIVVPRVHQSVRAQATGMSKFAVVDAEFMSLTLRSGEGEVCWLNHTAAHFHEKKCGRHVFGGNHHLFGNAQTCRRRVPMLGWRPSHRCHFGTVAQGHLPEVRMPVAPPKKKPALRKSTTAKSGRVSVPSLDEVKLNHVLAALSDQQLTRWMPELVFIDLPLGHVLYESKQPQRYIYFPVSAIVSLLYVMENGDAAEIAVVGNEGVVGISLFMGGNSTPSRALVQSAGVGYRIDAKFLKGEFDRSLSVAHLLLRYTQALITQMSQTAVCNRHHSVNQQLCRWLLLSLDRLAGNELVMTQELIANMLGVRREGVTEGALKLQEAGLIRYSRGRITVLDRKGLEARSCECYQVVKEEYERLLPMQLAA
jgi:CRP-like cAMP-binding protein